MIAQVSGQPAMERCVTPAYLECPEAKPLLEKNVTLDRCPYLHESLMQYCSAASQTKYIPYSEAILSQCGTDSHRYCYLFLAFAQPDRHKEISAVDTVHPELSTPGREVDVDGIGVRTDLLYTPNHMWADIGEDNTVHVGIDALLAGLLGDADQITFVTVRGKQRPTVVFSVNGTDLPVMFPYKMSITAVNTSLRAHPSDLFADPYTHGWLFEGTELEVPASSEETPGHPLLLPGSRAPVWMRNELRHVAKVVHELSHASDSSGVVLMADGGNPQPGVAQHLKRNELLHLFNDMFSPLAGWRNV